MLKTNKTIQKEVQTDGLVVVCLCHLGQDHSKQNELMSLNNDKMKWIKFKLVVQSLKLLVFSLQSPKLMLLMCTSFLATVYQAAGSTKATESLTLAVFINMTEDFL